jgi:hypothetical protein
MSSISAGTTTTTGYVVTSDTTGALVLKTGASGTTAVTIGSDQSVTFAGSQTFSGGTANGVLYLNGSKAATSGSALTFDGTTLQVANGDVYAANGSGSNLSIGFKQSSAVKFRLRYDIAGDSLSVVDASGNFCQTWSQGNTFTSFGVGGTENMRLTSTGLGIGTSSPAQRLSVNNTGGATTGGIRVYATDQGYARLNIQNENGQAYHLVAGTPGASNSGFAIFDATAGATRVQLDSSGNFGIGTSSPAARLDVSGGSIRVNEDGVNTKILTIRSNWAGVDPAINVTTSNALLLMTSNTERARITSGGNFGIGTSSPAQKLDVSSGDSVTRIAVTNTANAANGSGLQFLVLNGGTESSNVTIRADNADNIQFFNKGGERARITSDGKLLVGTTGNSGSQVRVISGSNNWAFQSNDIYRVFNKNAAFGSTSTTRTCSIDFASQGSNWSGHLVEVIFAGAYDVSGTVIAGKATFAVVTLTVLGVNEIEDIGQAVSFSAAASGTTLVVTATTTTLTNWTGWTVRVTSTNSFSAPTSISIA